ncbi:MAG: hypothetical protein OEW60_04135 [Thiovulaceae bacterium]|nr:hypothetical protein [Sulfurimonadaceae bacterium]
MIWNHNLYRVVFIGLLLPMYLSAQDIAYDRNTGYVTDRCFVIKNETLKKGTKLFILDH